MIEGRAKRTTYRCKVVRSSILVVRTNSPKEPSFVSVSHIGLSVTHWWRQCYSDIVYMFISYQPQVIKQSIHMLLVMNMKKKDENTYKRETRGILNHMYSKKKRVSINFSSNINRVTIFFQKHSRNVSKQNELKCIIPLSKPTGKRSSLICPLHAWIML